MNTRFRFNSVSYYPDRHREAETDEKKTQVDPHQQLLQKGKFLWARKLLEKKLLGSIGEKKLPVFKASRARLTLRVLDIVLQDDENKKDLHLLSNEEATRACMLSMTEREVLCGGSGPISIVSSAALSFQRLFVPTEPIEGLRILKEIWIGGKHCDGSSDQSTFRQADAIRKRKAF